ncbi:phage head closure protein [Dinoroseobacter sp. S124A]|uniref:phage head closure protein n=1 Tax=Dinoroseobacter sp. S124A TaxID=3415128 RepID=UPI003C7E6BBB
MDQRIAFQQKTRTADGMGGFTEAWANISTTPTVWAGVKVETAKEQEQAGRSVGVRGTLFVIRNRSDLDEGMRILWDSGIYNIREIHREGGRAHYLRIVAERGVA